MIQGALPLLRLEVHSAESLELLVAFRVLQGAAGAFLVLGVVLAGYLGAVALDGAILYALILFGLAFFLLAIYYSGGERSWLFLLLVVRVADERFTLEVVQKGDGSGYKIVGFER